VPTKIAPSARYSRQVKNENQNLLGASGTAHSAKTALISRPITTMFARPHRSPKLVM
jgi:hypothetical protein